MHAVVGGGRGLTNRRRHYQNIARLLDELELPVAECYGLFAETAFWSSRGLEVVSPVLGDLPRLPAPLGPLVHTADRFTDLPLLDRFSAFPLTQALLEFDVDDAAYARYDQTSFEALCRKVGVSDGLYTTFLEPVLLALLFAPPRELSAAAALSVLSNYVLMHQADFDVRWPKVPPSRIFTTWRARLEGAGVEFRNATRVAQVLRAREGTDAVGGVELDGGEVLEADAVILACGAAALPKIVAASEALRGCAGLARCGELRCSPVSAVRLRRAGGAAPLRYEANVFGGGARPGVAGTFYDLGALRGEERGREFEGKGRSRRRGVVGGG